MKKAILWVPALALLAFAGPPFWSPPRKTDGGPPDRVPPPKVDEKPELPPFPKPEQPALAVVEPVLYEELRGVINRGVDLYNKGEIDACYRLFEGSLRTVKPLLKHREALVKRIEKDLDTVEGQPVAWRRAFQLRFTLDAVRKEIRPRPAEKDDKEIEKKVEKKEPFKGAEKKEGPRVVEPDGKEIE